MSTGPRGGVGRVYTLGDPPAAFSGLHFVFETLAPGYARSAPPTFDPPPLHTVFERIYNSVIKRCELS